MDTNEIESLTARMAAALVRLKHLRAAMLEYGAACYRRGRADGMGMPIAARAEQLAVREANDKSIHLFGEIADTLHVPSSATGQVRVSDTRPPIVAQPPAMPPPTPAEARTGISDRTAAALADVADLRKTLRTNGAFVLLDRIEQALRADGAA